MYISLFMLLMLLLFLMHVLKKIRNFKFSYLNNMSQHVAHVTLWVPIGHVRCELHLAIFGKAPLNALCLNCFINKPASPNSI